LEPAPNCGKEDVGARHKAGHGSTCYRGKGPLCLTGITSGHIERDQREARLRVLLLLQMRRRPGQDHLEGRPHLTFEQMPADDAAVRAAEHRMDMQGRLAVRVRDIAEQRQYLDLLVDRDALVVLFRPVEIADHRALEGADRGQRGGVDLLLADKLLQGADRLVAMGEDDGVSRRRAAIEQFPAHRNLWISARFNEALPASFRYWRRSDRRPACFETRLVALLSMRWA